MDPNTEQQNPDAETTPAPEAVAEAPATPAEPTSPESPEASKADDVDATLAAMLGTSAPAETPAQPEQTAEAPAEAAKPAEPSAPAPADPDAAKVDAEVKELGLKGASETRFREMSARIRELETAHPAMQRMAEWESAIQQTGATPEQFGAAMTYLSLVNSGDPATIEAAFQQIESEYLTLAKALGRPVGGYDPLDDHPDLKEAVANVDMSRELALELAQARTRQQQTQQARQVQDQTDAQRRAWDDGTKALQALDAELAASDPAYKAKLQVLAPAIQAMCAAAPPAEWAGRVRDMFARLQLPAAAPAPSPAPAALPPLRPTVPGGTQVSRVVDPVDATLAAMMAAK
jgi:hypothetical protein